MKKFDDSLRGYSYETHDTDKFKCRYCGIDGTKSFDTWLTLSLEHLLPKGHTDRDKPEFMVTSCNFCNTAENRFFDKANELGLQFHNMTQEQLIAQRRPFVMQTRQDYKKFWVEYVMSSE